MNKKVVVLNESTGTIFGLENRNVTISEKMAVADAEAINAIYPGVYVDVVETEAKTDKKTEVAKTA